jgi:uncharacterized protein YecE (DUF72 family)
MSQINIGTSGWSYTHWKNSFYNGIAKKNWLRYYAEHFSSVEVNATFYRLQTSDTFKRWYKNTPESFTFAVKGNHYLTHNKKLLDPINSVLMEKEHASSLGKKLAVILWQLPKTAKKDLPRLKLFLQALQQWTEVHHTLEFRHNSWFDDETAAYLTSCGITVCISDSADWPMWKQVTTDIVYIRLHGHSLTYASSYNHQELALWAEQIDNWLSVNKQVFVYFDNDAECAAPNNALELKSLLTFRSGQNFETTANKRNS